MDNQVKEKCHGHAYSKSMTQSLPRKCLLCGEEEAAEGGVEVVKHAAVKSKDGWIFIGKHHADCFHKAHNVNIKMSSSADDQGFITNNGRYLKRSEAAELAFKSGQIDKPTQLLFSEDLWSVVYDGKYNYDEVRGYMRKEDSCPKS